MINKGDSMLDNLNEEQKKAVEKTEGPVLVLAGAGSGKTKVLTTRVAYLVNEKEIDPYNILAITFTNKAAKEMKDRVFKMLGIDAYRIQISTFHSLGLLLVRENYDKLGYEKNFTILDSEDTLTVIKKILKEMNLDPKVYNPRAIKNKISSSKNELMDSSAYSRFANSDYEQIILEIFQKYERKWFKMIDFD